MSVRVTRKVRRVLDLLARQGATVREISDGTNISLPTLWPLLDRMADSGWIAVDGRTYSLTEAGRTARKQAQEDAKRQRVANWPDARPRGPRPPYMRRPYTDRRTPWPKGEGRPR